MQIYAKSALGMDGRKFEHEIFHLTISGQFRAIFV